AIGAAVRQLHRDRSAFHGSTTPRDRELPALPVDRCVDRQGALPALVPRCLRRCAPQTGGAPCARGHPRVDRGARVLPVDDLRRRRQLSATAIAGASTSRTHAGTATAAAARAAARRPRTATASTTTVAPTNRV